MLPAVDVPMLVCAGADESRGTVASVEHVASLVPDVTVGVYAESGHCPTLEDPARFNAVLDGVVRSR